MKHEELIERLQGLHDAADPVQWEACDDAILDKQHGFIMGRMESEIYPSGIDKANAAMIVGVVNALPDIISALRARGEG